VLARDPETVEVYLFIGDMFFDGELYELAIRFYKQARSDHPHCVEAYLREGDAYTRLGRFVQAAERYTLALARSPRCDAAWLGKGSALNLAGRPAEALQAYRSMQTYAPDSPAVYVGQGLALQGLGHHKEAIAAFDRALQIEPGSVRALTNKATSLGALGQDEAAIATYEQALDADSTGEFTKYVNYNLGLLLKKLARYEEAIDAYNRALEQEPTFGLALLDKAIACLESGRDEDALAALDLLVGVEPANGKAHALRASVLAIFKRYQEALRAYNRALALHYDTPVVRRQRERIRAKLHKS
jgi:tetratricopeptide (TPR) repeat protein